MVDLKFGMNRMRTWIHHALLPLCRLVVVVGDVFLAHFRPLSANWASFKHTHPLMATSSRIMHQVTKLESFQIGFLNRTKSSVS